MGAAQVTREAQLTVEKKVREKAAALERSPPGYRPAIGYQAGRLLPAVDGPAYGMVTNTFLENTRTTPFASDERFEKKYEHRGVGYSKVDAIEKPDEILAFDVQEAYGGSINDPGNLAPQISVQA